MSGASCAIFASAIWPFAAVPITSSCGSLASASATSRRTTTESSTTSTRIGDTPSPLVNVGLVEVEFLIDRPARVLSYAGRLAVGVVDVTPGGAVGSR